MPAGRPRKTKEQKELQGTYRPDRDNLDAPPKGELIIGMDAPDFFDSTEKMVWDQVFGELKKINLVYSVDVMSLVILCQELGSYFRLHKLSRGKLVTEDESGRLQYNADMYKIKATQSQHLKNAKTLMVDFGLSPQARQKLQMALIDPSGEREANQDTRNNVLPPKPE